MNRHHTVVTLLAVIAVLPGLILTGCETTRAAQFGGVPVNVFVASDTFLSGGQYSEIAAVLDHSVEPGKAQKLYITVEWHSEGGDPDPWEISPKPVQDPELGSEQQVWHRQVKVKDGYSGRGVAIIRAGSDPDPKQPRKTIVIFVN